MSTVSAEQKSEEAATTEEVAAPSEVNAPAASDTSSNQSIEESHALPLQERRRRRTSVALVIICVLVVLYTIYFARTILMPIVGAIILTLLLRPAVRTCRKYRIPDAVSAAVVLSVVVVILVGMLANLIGPAKDWSNDAPEKLREVGTKLKVIRDHVEDLNRLNEAVEEMADVEPDEDDLAEAAYPFAPETDSNIVQLDGEQTQPPRPEASGWGDENKLQQAANRPASSNEPVQVQIQQPSLVSGIEMLTSTGTYVGGVLAELFLMLVLCYFLLASGDVLINNVLRILPSRKEKRTTVELVYTVERGISSYLLTVTAINICLGIAIACAMWLLGVPNPVLWGAMATLFNFVPFLGALCGTVVVFLVSILSFHSVAYAFVPPVVYWSITALEGNFITPHIIGRSMSLNPIMVFLSLSLWGWMWGIGGALLAVPILAVLKVSFDQFERTKALGTLLGGSSSV